MAPCVPKVHEPDRWARMHRNRNITTNEGQGLNKPWGPAADTESGGSMSRDAREEVTHK